MVARVRRSGLTPKLMSAWTGPWRIVTADKIYVYRVQNVVTGEVKDVPRACGTPPVLRGQILGDDGGFKGGVSTCFHTGRV